MRRLLANFLLLLLVTSVTRAQGTSPDSTVARLLRLLDAGDWHSAALLFDRAAAERSRTEMIPMMRSFVNRPPGEFNPIALGRDALQLDSAGRARADAMRINGIADTAVTLAGLARVPVEEFLALGVMAKSRTRMTQRYQVIGSAVEGDSIAHVVLRGATAQLAARMTGDPGASTEMVHLVRSNGLWLIAGRNTVMSALDMQLVLMMPSIMGSFTRPSAANPAAAASGATCKPPENPYFEFQVERPARYIPDASVSPSPNGKSAAQTLVQFVVDTVGVPDAKTLKILKEPAGGAPVDEIKAAVLKWRYFPAKIGACAVPELVQTPVMK